jgi:hypothetical protein
LRITIEISGIVAATFPSFWPQTFLSSKQSCGISFLVWWFLLLIMGLFRLVPPNSPDFEQIKIRFYANKYLFLCKPDIGIKKLLRVAVGQHDQSQSFM